MSEGKWTDATTYSRHYSKGDRLNPVEPKAWRVKSGPVEIWIGKDHRDYPGEWVMHCAALGINTKALRLPGDTDAKIAQNAAWNTAMLAARAILQAIERIAP